MDRQVAQEELSRKRPKVEMEEINRETTASRERIAQEELARKRHQLEMEKIEREASASMEKIAQIQAKIAQIQADSLAKQTQSPHTSHGGNA